MRLAASLIVVLSFLLLPVGLRAQWAAPVEIRSAQAYVLNFSVDGHTICTCFAVESPRHERYVVSAGHCAQHLTDESKVIARSVETGVQYPLHLRAPAEAWPNQHFS